jgi:hypothetical protein
MKPAKTNPHAQRLTKREQAVKDAGGEEAPPKLKADAARTEKLKKRWDDRQSLTTKPATARAKVQRGDDVAALQANLKLVKQRAENRQHAERWKEVQAARALLPGRTVVSPASLKEQREYLERRLALLPTDGRLQELERLKVLIAQNKFLEPSRKIVELENEDKQKQVEARQKQLEAEQERLEAELKQLEAVEQKRQEEERKRQEEERRRQEVLEQKRRAIEQERARIAQEARRLAAAKLAYTQVVREEKGLSDRIRPLIEAALESANFPSKKELKQQLVKMDAFREEPAQSVEGQQAALDVVRGRNAAWAQLEATYNRLKPETKAPSNEQRPKLPALGDYIPITNYAGTVDVRVRVDWNAVYDSGAFGKGVARDPALRDAYLRAINKGFIPSTSTGVSGVKKEPNDHYMVKVSIRDAEGTGVDNLVSLVSDGSDPNPKSDGLRVTFTYATQRH